MSFIDLPNELLLSVAEYLCPNSIYSLVQTNRRLSILLAPQLLKFAWGKKYCVVALYLAAAGSNEETIRLLIDKPLPMFIRYSWWGTAKSQDEKEALVECLLRKGAESIHILYTTKHHESTSSSQERFTCIELAVESKKTSLARILLGKGAKKSIIRKYGPDMLFSAFKNRDEAMIRLLLENGNSIGYPLNNPNLGFIRNSSVTRVFFEALKMGEANIARLFVEFGADINTQGYPYHRSILINVISCIVQGFREAVSESIVLCIELGADTNLRDAYGETALDMAESVLADPTSENYKSVELACTLLRSYGAVHGFQLEQVTTGARNQLV